MKFTFSYYFQVLFFILNYSLLVKILCLTKAMGTDCFVLYVFMICFLNFGSNNLEEHYRTTPFQKRKLFKEIFIKHALNYKLLLLL